MSRHVLPPLVSGSGVGVVGEEGLGVKVRDERMLS